MKEYWEIFSAFKIKLSADNDKDAENSSRYDNCQDIYLQRLGKCLIDAFHTFFIPEVISMYGGLEIFQESSWN